EAPQSAGQVGDEKTNVCEPLLTHREKRRWHRNRDLWVVPGQRRAQRGEPSAREQPARGPGGARCIGGGSPLVARGRPASGEHRKRQSTDAGHRDGPARSSDEGPVMGLEPRGRTVQGCPTANPSGEEPGERQKQGEVL